MTRAELVKAIKSSKGKLNAEVLIADDVTYIFVEKADVIRWAERNYTADQETGMTILHQRGQYFFERG